MECITTFGHFKRGERVPDPVTPIGDGWKLIDTHSVVLHESRMMQVWTWERQPSALQSDEDLANLTQEMRPPA